MSFMRWSEEISASAPTIKNHSVTHFNGYLYCFGGYDGRRNHNVLLIYSISEKKWIWPFHVESPNDPAVQNNNGNHHPYHNQIADSSIIVHGNLPPGRNGHSATLATDSDDEKDHARIFIIGGWLGAGPLAASDCHILDISNGGKQLTWYQPAIKGTPPGACNMHSADFVKKLRSVYVFRGGNGREYLNDLHALHVDTLKWSRVETTGTAPQQRANHSSAMLEETGELFIFGGWNGTERLNDIHILDTETSTWSCPRVGGILPHPRAGMTLTALRGRLFLFGGSGTSAKCFQDLQILSRHETAWLDVTQDADGESSGRHHYRGHNEHTMRYDTDESIFRFGRSDPYDDRTMRTANVNVSQNAGEQQGGYGLETNCATTCHAVQDGSVQDSGASFASSGADWRSRDMAVTLLRHSASINASPNPNDEDTVPSVHVLGRGPGRRAGHTATAVNRKIYIFGGSCGSDYLNDFFVLDTDPAPQAVVREATSLQLMERRLRHFFNDEEFADVIFVVQGRKVYGHKLILSLVSDCFRAMFTTGFRESDAMEIEIPDCSHFGFLTLMQYIYTGALPKIDTNQDQDANISHLVEMLELADRFFLDHLKQVCETMLQVSVNEDTVEFILGVAQKTNATQLQAICEHFYRNQDG